MELRSALRKAEQDPQVRVIILKGAGKAWCAGGDLDELLQLTQGSADGRRNYLVNFKAMIDTVRSISKPIILPEQRQPVFALLQDFWLRQENTPYGNTGRHEHRIFGRIPAAFLPTFLAVTYSIQTFVFQLEYF